MGSEQTLAEAMEFVSTQGVLRVTRDELTTEYSFDQIHDQVTAFMRGQRPENVVTGGTETLPIRELTIKEAVAAAEATGIIENNRSWFERPEFQAMINRAPEPSLSSWGWPGRGIRDRHPCSHVTLLYDRRGKIVGWEEQGWGDQNKLYGGAEAIQLEKGNQLRRMVVVFPVGVDQIKGQCARCFLPRDVKDRDHLYVSDHVVMATMRSYNEDHAEAASLEIDPWDPMNRGDWLEDKRLQVDPCLIK